MTTDSITLSSAMRFNLHRLQDTSKFMEVTHERLATGKRVNSALDNPVVFFTALSHNQRADDLSFLKSEMLESIQAIQAANEGIDAITQLIMSAKSLARQSLSAETAEERNTLATQYAEILKQINYVAADAGYKGINLITGENQTLVTKFDESGDSKITTIGCDGRANGLRLDVNVLGFDDLDADGQGQGTDYALISDGYGGLNWNNLRWIDCSRFPGTGCEKSPTSGGYSALNANGNDATINVGNGSFNFQSAYLTNAGISTTRFDVTFTGSKGGQPVHSKTVTVNADGPIRVNFDFKDIDTLEITTPGVERVAIDDFAYNFADQPGAPVTTPEWDFNSKVEAHIQAMDDALTILRNASEKLITSLNVITTRLGFTENLVETLVEGASNLTNADMNEEGAAMLMLETLQALGVTSLSLASQTTRSVLELFFAPEPI